MNKSLTISVRKSAGWAIIEQENNWDLGLQDVDIFADEIGVEVGRLCLIELRDANNNILDRREIKAQ
jgi:hypothetical protein